MINTVSGICLDTDFADKSPGYPVFSVLITSANRAQAAQDALRAIAGQHLTKQAAAVLDALELQDGASIAPGNSRYAKQVLDIFGGMAHGQVLNRAEIIHDDHGIEYFDPTNSRLEPEWLIVVLAALVWSGDIELAIINKTFTAADLKELAATGMNDLINFKHLAKPKGWNQQGLAALFGLLNLPLGKVQQIVQGDTSPIGEMQAKLTESVNNIVRKREEVRDGYPFLGANLLSDLDTAAISLELDAAKTFFEKLQVYTTVGKLKNFSYSPGEVEQYKTIGDTLARLTALDDFIRKHGKIGAWLEKAENILPVGNDWKNNYEKLRADALKQLASADAKTLAGISGSLAPQLQELKSEYIAWYLVQHAKARLGAKASARRDELANDSRLRNLQNLAAIDLLPASQLTDFQNKLAGFKSCPHLTETDIKNNPLCPHCCYRPDGESAVLDPGLALDNLDNQLDEMTENWTQIILDNLNDPHTRENMNLLRSDDINAVAAFLKAGKLPDKLDKNFVHAVSEALSGLAKVSMNMADIRKILAAGPATPEEMKQRFAQYLDQLVLGKDADKVRLVLE